MKLFKKNNSKKEFAKEYKQVKEYYKKNPLTKKDNEYLKDLNKILKNI
jgi:hypothetical protein